ncbi:MAG: hypothetical protein DRI87_09605 [Bacteroidetes bacterium]|nr:MAG: hypothetical protein DRI87_09605 [Bacteroidota bacterium]
MEWIKNCQMCNDGIVIGVNKYKDDGESERAACRHMADDAAKEFPDLAEEFSFGAIHGRYERHGKGRDPHAAEKRRTVARCDTTSQQQSVPTTPPKTTPEIIQKKRNKVIAAKLEAEEKSRKQWKDGVNGVLYYHKGELRIGRARPVVEDIMRYKADIDWLPLQTPSTIERLSGYADELYELVDYLRSINPQRIKEELHGGGKIIDIGSKNRAV